MLIFDRYIFRQLIVATVITSFTLAAIILLTQSLRFLELVMDAGASAISFGALTLLALPRFFEIILPISVMAATVFVYNRMSLDHELTVMRALGKPPSGLARPALYLALIATVLLWFITAWLAPVSLSNMQYLRQVIKAQYSTLLFREGVFNNVRPGLTVFIRERTPEGEMLGLMIHDSREGNDVPVNILAKSGRIIASDDGHQVLVYDGSRQSINPKTGVLNRLDFNRYTIDLPDDSGPVRQRWREPDERTLFELIYPDPESRRDIQSQREFAVEAHRRIVSPLLAPGFTLMALAALLVGPMDRRGQGRRIALAVITAIIVQGLYLGAFNIARQSNFGLLLMYVFALAPILLGSFVLSRYSEALRRHILFATGKRAA